MTILVLLTAGIAAITAAAAIEPPNKATHLWCDFLFVTGVGAVWAAGILIAVAVTQ